MKKEVQKPFPFHAGQCICLILELNSAKQSGEGINYFKVRPEFVSCVPMVVKGLLRYRPVSSWVFRKKEVG